jgi:two-component system nitrate/nitrite response regulator NarL
VRRDRRCSVFLVDPNDIFRSGCRALFASDARFVVAGEASTVDELRPEMLSSGVDVILLDPDLDGHPALSGVRTVASLAPLASILLLLDHADTDFVRLALEAGVRGVLLKARLSGMLVLKIAMVLTTARSSVIDTTLLLDLIRGPAPTPIRVERAPDLFLTRREAQVLDLLASGLSDREIARELGVARTTVHSHISSLFRKLPATNRVQLGILAARSGLLNERVADGTD